MERIVFSAGPLDTNCYVLHEGGRATVVDPGMGAAAQVRRIVADLGLEVESVLLTHGHIDHVRDAGEVQREHGATVHLHEADMVWLDRGTVASGLGPLGELFEVADMVLPEDVRHYGDTVVVAGQEHTVHHMPGHSPGSVMLRGPEGILGGDVLFRGGVGRVDLPFSSPEDMMASLARLTSEFGDGELVLPGHGPSTTVGEEKRTNPFLRSVG